MCEHSGPPGWLAAAAVRVRTEVGVAATTVGDVRVALRRREVGVTEHLLDAAEVGTPFEEGRGKRVPEEGGVDARRIQPCLFGEAAKDQERSRAREGSAACVEEEVGAVAAIEMRPAEGEVAPYRLGGGPSERHDSLLVALAEHADDASVEVDRGAREPDRLGHP